MHNWFRSRGYRHFDSPVEATYGQNAENPAFVGSHSFLPLLHYVKETKRYKPKINKTESKKRDIMYASHRDACIFSFYSYVLSNRLNECYKELKIDESVIAYRKLDKANYDFAAEVVRYAQHNSPCTILCFDVSDFFGTLDHKLLKQRLRKILKVSELPADWYAIYRQVTKFSWVKSAELKIHPSFVHRWKQRHRSPIATIQEIKAAGITIQKNSKTAGIPQGTPISSVLSNLYMIDFDVALTEFCAGIGALYRRYSDDIIIICPTGVAATVENHVIEKIEAERLSINRDKTERHIFDPSSKETAQYLGFIFSLDGVFIRQSSLGRQWRKMRKSVNRIRRTGEKAMLDGTADKIYTRSLRRRFTALPVRNFSSYARRAAEALGSERILNQVRRLEKYLENQLKEFPSKKTK